MVMKKFKNRQAKLTYTLVTLLTLVIVYMLLSWATAFNQYSFSKALVVIVVGALSVDYVSTWVSKQLGLLK
jgi:hypothetical protein